MGARGVGEGDSYGGYRTRLVNELQAKGIRDLAVLRAVAQVPRHLFVPHSLRHRAYEDSALPIAGGQTISQPWVQARYLELAQLTGREKVLEIGTGSGYQTALLGAARRERSSASNGCPTWPGAPGPHSTPPGCAMSRSWWVTVRWAGGPTRPTT